eukprot:946389-Pelagomonas_calceolata.AAC.1
MSTTSVYGQKWSLTYRFPQRCDRSAVKNWARQICNREQSFDGVVSKLTDPQHAPQYQGVVVGVEELQQGGKRRTWEAVQSSCPTKVPACPCKLISSDASATSNHPFNLVVGHHAGLPGPEG